MIYVTIGLLVFILPGLVHKICCLFFCGDILISIGTNKGKTAKTGGQLLASK